MFVRIFQIEIPRIKKYIRVRRKVTCGEIRCRQQMFAKMLLRCSQKMLPTSSIEKFSYSLFIMNNLNLLVNAIEQFKLSQQAKSFSCDAL